MRLSPLGKLLIFLAFISNLSCKSGSVLIRTSEDLPQSLSNTIEWSEFRSYSSNTPLHKTQQTLRLAFHFMYGEGEDPIYNLGESQDFVQGLIDASNERLAKNAKMNLPIGNDTHVKDAEIRLKLHSINNTTNCIFIHHDDLLCHFIKKGRRSNRYSKVIINKYGYNSDSVINVFIMPFSSEEIQKGRQKIESTGIALGNSIKIAGVFEMKKAPWFFAGILNHEIGHVLGLNHSWTGFDGCDDTPKNPNCWNTSDSPPCTGLTSNNLMDYNAHQSAITPCQIERMHSSLMTPGSRQSKLTYSNWCEDQRMEVLAITDTTLWNHDMYITSNIEVEKGGVLYISSSISFSKGKSIIIRKGGTVLLDSASLYNECGLQWFGIVAERGSTIHQYGENRLMNTPTEYSEYPN